MVLVKVAVVAEFEPLRLGLANMIDEHPQLALAGVAAGLEEMLVHQECRAADVVVMDVEVAYRTPLELVEKTAKSLPGLKVLLLGSEQDAKGVQPETVPAYLAMAGLGFLVKGVSNERLASAIILLNEGVFVAEMWLMRHVLTQLSRWANEDTETSRGQLTEREMEVLRLVADGLSNRAIANALFLSEGTVKIHVSHIMAKLAMDRRTELVRYAVQRGLVTEGGW